METVTLECPAAVWTPVGENVNEILVKMRGTGQVKLHAGTGQPANDTTNFVTVNNEDGPVAIGYADPFSVWVMAVAIDGEVVEVIRG